ncbi:unnamed protein product, partial [Symbiodinium necroappetens]
DAEYASPTSMEQFMSDNREMVQQQDICRNLDVKCQEKQPPAWSHVMQGVVFELGGGVLDDKFKPTEAATIAGKLHFFAQSLFGKAGAAPIGPFYQHAAADWTRRNQKEWKLSVGLKSAIAFLRHGPALFEIKDADTAPAWGNPNPPAFLNGRRFVAGVRDKVLYASGFVPGILLAAVHTFTCCMEIVVQILPLYVLVGIPDKCCIMFVYSEPACHALGKGYGSDEQVNKFVKTVWLCIESHGLIPQWQRVSSTANVSEDVSRGEFREAERRGWQRSRADWDQIFATILQTSMEGPF